jgi:hypothetical protein
MKFANSRKAPTSTAEVAAHLGVSEDEFAVLSPSLHFLLHGSVDDEAWSNLDFPELSGRRYADLLVGSIPGRESQRRSSSTRFIMR